MWGLRTGLSAALALCSPHPGLCVASLCPAALAHPSWTTQLLSRSPHPASGSLWPAEAPTSGLVSLASATPFGGESTEGCV